MTFLAWIKGRRHDDNAIGDLSRDIASDRRRKPGNTIDGWIGWLRDAHACHECIETMHRAWSAYSVGNSAGNCGQNRPPNRPQTAPSDRRFPE